MRLSWPRKGSDHGDDARILQTHPHRLVGRGGYENPGDVLRRRAGRSVSGQQLLPHSSRPAAAVGESARRLGAGVDGRAVCGELPIASSANGGNDIPHRRPRQVSTGPIALISVSSRPHEAQG